MIRIFDEIPGLPVQLNELLALVNKVAIEFIGREGDARMLADWLARAITRWPSTRRRR